MKTDPGQSKSEHKRIIGHPIARPTMKTADMQFRTNGHTVQDVKSN